MKGTSVPFQIFDQNGFLFEIGIISEIRIAVKGGFYAPSIKILFLGFSVEGMAQIVLKSNDYLQKEDTSFNIKGVYILHSLTLNLKEKGGRHSQLVPAYAGKDEASRDEME